MKVHVSFHGQVNPSRSQALGDFVHQLSVIFNPGGDTADVDQVEAVLVMRYAEVYVVAFEPAIRWRCPVFCQGDEQYGKAFSSADPGEGGS